METFVGRTLYVQELPIICDCIIQFVNFFYTILQIFIFVKRRRRRKTTRDQCVVVNRTYNAFFLNTISPFTSLPVQSIFPPKVVTVNVVDFEQHM